MFLAAGSEIRGSSLQRGSAWGEGLWVGVSSEVNLKHETGEKFFNCHVADTLDDIEMFQHVATFGNPQKHPKSIDL